ncbi:MAG: hypothetical protein JSS09_05265, partial [Verrucomicrobia bacterium]|nr:hypothetical protein [Verrucomicrobiota bacterium]
MKTFIFFSMCIFSLLSSKIVSENSLFFKNHQNQAVQNILVNCKNIGLSLHEVEKIVYFIENHLFDLIPEKGYYINKKITKLPCDIEYDPSSNLVFIHLDQIISEDSKSKILKKSI